MVWYFWGDSLGEPLRRSAPLVRRRLASGYARFASLIPARTDAHQRCACALGTAAVGGSRYYPSREGKV
jgi:hypothetical protein